RRSAREAGAEAAVDRERGPCDEARLVRGEEEDDVRDLRGLGHSPERVGGGGGRLPAAGMRLLLRPLEEQAGAHAARTNRVDSDPVGRAVESEAPGQAYDAGFGCGVREHLAAREERVDR